jgi:hypothetical protein
MERCTSATKAMGMRPVALAVIAQIVNYLDAPYVVDDALGFAVGPHCRTQCHNCYGHRFCVDILNGAGQNL